jgi:hypothetical protein
MASFGGYVCFEAQGFQGIWSYSGDPGEPTNPYYVIPSGANNTYTISDLQTSANLLATDLVNFITTNNLDGIDLDIENVTYSSNTIDYTGLLSQSIKTKNSDLVVSHAPQMPYWVPYYYYVNLNYGQYIDFYNWQYYNIPTGLYDTAYQLFINDNQLPGGQAGYGAAVLQLNTGGCPLEKIVIGTGIDGAGGTSDMIGGNNFTRCAPDPTKWASYTSIIQTQQDTPYPLNGNTAYTYTQDQLNNLSAWYNSGGVMIWRYITDDTSISTTDLEATNTNMMTFYNSLKH